MRHTQLFCMKRVGILTSGGDCSGLNAVIAATVKTGLGLGYEFIGFEFGWEGVLSPLQYRPLTRDGIRGISYTGGTILKTTNRGRFGGKVGEGGVRMVPTEVLEEAKRNLAELDVHALVVIGGDGSLASALQLARIGVNLVGVPKTIDNDLCATDRTFGYSTAVEVVVESLDRIHTTAASHNRIFIVETMGRNAGWIAVRSGVAGGADAILLPEFPFAVPDLVEFLRYRQREFGSSVVVVAEGARIKQRLVARDLGRGEVLLGGVAYELLREIEVIAPNEFDVRCTVLGHVQRGGSPNPADRILAKAYGVEAMHMVHRGEFGRMVAYDSQKMVSVPIEAAVGQLKLVTESTMEYVVARELGVFVH